MPPVKKRNLSSSSFSSAAIRVSKSLSTTPPNPAHPPSPYPSNCFVSVLYLKQPLASTVAGLSASVPMGKRIAPLALISKITLSFGVSVPNPTLPLLANRILSVETPPSSVKKVKPFVSSALIVTNWLFEITPPNPAQPFSP